MMSHIRFLDVLAHLLTQPRIVLRQKHDSATGYGKHAVLDQAEFVVERVWTATFRLSPCCFSWN